MKNKMGYFYGIVPYEFIWHGSQSDPEIRVNNKYYNYYTVETYVYENFIEDLEGLGIETKGMKEKELHDMFCDYIKAHEYMIEESIEALDECGDFRS